MQSLMPPVSPQWALLIMFKVLLLPVRSINALAPSSMARLRSPVQLRSTSTASFRSYPRSGASLQRPLLSSLVACSAGGHIYVEHARARLTARYSSSSSDNGSNDSNPTASTSSSSALEPMESERRLAGVRTSMKALGLDALIVPSDDPHLSE